MKTAYAAVHTGNTKAQFPSRNTSNISSMTTLGMLLSLAYRRHNIIGHTNECNNEITPSINPVQRPAIGVTWVLLARCPAHSCLDPPYAVAQGLCSHVAWKPLTQQLNYLAQFLPCQHSGCAVDNHATVEGKQYWPGQDD